VAADGKARAEPQISANDLALYLVSTDVGKLGIIRRNKYPSKHIVSPYQDCKRIIMRFLADDARNRDALVAGVEQFEQAIEKSTTLPSKREDARRSISALHAVLTGYNQLGLGKLQFNLAPRLDSLLIRGVKVSVNLDLLTHANTRGVDQQGGAVLRLTQADESNKRDEMGAITATLAFMQVEDKLPGVGEPVAKLCLAIDVQNKAKYEARAGSRRRSNIEAACTMIKSVWSSV
jgi:hypothetical protein